LLNELGSWIT